MVNLSGRMFARSLHQQQTLLLEDWALWDPNRLSKGCSEDRSDVAESRSDWSTGKGCSTFSPCCANPLCIITAVLVEMMCLAGRQRCRKVTFLRSAIYSSMLGTVAINIYPSSNFPAAKEERSLGAIQFPGCNKYMHICMINAYIIPPSLKALILALGFALEKACATSLVLTHKVFSPFACFFQSLFPWISFFAVLSTRHLPVLA